MGCVTALPRKLPLKSHSGISASCFRQTQGAIISLALRLSKYTPLEAGVLRVCGMTMPQGSAQSSLGVLRAPASAQCQPCRMGAGSLQRSMKINPMPCYGSEPELVFEFNWQGLCSGQTWQYCLSVTAGSGSKIAVFSAELESVESQATCCAWHKESMLEMNCP